jgi:putative proteasome-type protease
MTYCVGLLVKEGLVLISDTRTNAGIDNIACFRKLHLFEGPDRLLAISTSGNLSVSQAVLGLLNEGFANPETGETETLAKATSMFHAAQMAGQAVREVYRIDGPSMEQHNASFDIALLLGGQIKGRRLRLFMIYAAGNFIEATADTPYLQIGEHKYGKPILDRSIKVDTSLADALKLGLISMDSTIRSNLSVGLPIDILTIRRDTFTADTVFRIDEAEPYFHDLREKWSSALRAAHQAIQPPPYPPR